MEKTDIKSLTLNELQEQLVLAGEKSFRARQVYSWIHEKLARNFEDMTNLSIDFREWLKDNYYLTEIQKEEIHISKIDGTRKYLFSLYDGNVVESVLMKYKHGYSVCISTQVGCRQGCRFCASTIGGLDRNLLASELLEQVYEICRDIGEKISNIVLMGTGEPLDNYHAVLRFIHLVSGENGLHISQRNITMSTCGLVPEIYKLAEEKLQITLAISLHATEDSCRKEIMPVANKYSIQELLKACTYYFEKTGRRISFEYSLIQGVNDSQNDAEKLAVLLKGMNCHVNLIPINPVDEREYIQTGMKDVEKFRYILEKNRINATIRREMGRDINGACGQLRKSHSQKISSKE